MLEPKKATQRAYFSMIETACSLKKPVIIDTDSLQAKKEKRDTWVGNDSTYVLAEKKRNANAVGRMRISHDYSPNVIEIWGDVDANKKMKTRQEVCAHFKELHEATMRWIDAHLKMGIPEDCVYVVSSGFGFHTHVFIEGIGSFEEYQDVVQALFEKSGLPNSKGLGERMSDKVVYGIDLNRIKASNTKLRDVGGANEKYEDGTVHYASALTVKEFRDLKAYPYVSNPADVRYPNLTVWKMPRGWTANNVVGATRPSSQPVSGKLADYPCLRAILNARETSNEARLWLVMALKNKLKMGEGECTQLLCSNAKWEDLVTDSKGSMGTPYHVHKIYSKKNADGRDAYGKPPKKANLVAEGYCKPGVCGRCKL